MRDKELITVECGCVHNNEMWVEYCGKHRKEIKQTRREWSDYLKVRELSEDNEHRNAGF